MNVLNATICLDLYEVMLRIRLTEEKVSEIYPSDKIQSPIHLSTGQEAVATGVCRALLPEDHVYGTYRGHGLYVAKGGDLKRLFAELYGKDTGCARGKGGSMHLLAVKEGLMGCSAVVATTIPLAAGDALASQMQGRSRVAVAFFGDGAVDTGIFFESVNFALLKNLPLLFVLENNGYAVHSRVSDRHKRTDLYRIAEGLGLKGHRFDGNNVFDVYSATIKAVKALRKGGAPMLLEFMTYRWQEHVGPNSDLTEGYRQPGEQKVAWKADPLKIAERVLKRRFKIPEKKLAQQRDVIAREINLAVQFAQNSPFPVRERLLEDVFL